MTRLQLGTKLFIYQRHAHFTREKRKILVDLVIRYGLEKDKVFDQIIEEPTRSIHTKYSWRRMEKSKELDLDHIQIEQSDIFPASSNTTQLVLMHSLVDMRSGVGNAFGFFEKWILLRKSGFDIHINQRDFYILLCGY